MWDYLFWLGEASSAFHPIRLQDSFIISICGQVNIVVFSWRKSLTLSWRRSLSYRNQSIDLLRWSMGWFLYDNGLRHERVKGGGTWDYYFLIAFGQWCLSFRLKDSLISNKIWKNQLVYFIFCMVIIIKGR